MEKFGINKLLLSLAFLLVFSGSVGATPISSCTTISSPVVYVLATDITNSSAFKCIEITASDVVLDGNGFTVDGVNKDFPSYGVYVDDSGNTLTNITVKKLNVTNWY